MPSIKLFELGQTRSARVRWMLLEAELPYDSAGNSVEVFRSAELRSIHPLGKLPAAIIDGKPLFESAAIVTAIADLVPEKGLIAGPRPWSRNLHYQWLCFALTEMEPCMGLLLSSANVGCCFFFSLVLGSGGTEPVTAGRIRRSEGSSPLGRDPIAPHACIR
jgi:hypothetical protein